MTAFLGTLSSSYRACDGYDDVMTVLMTAMTKVYIINELARSMGSRIPESSKLLVYQKFMLGLSRDQTAAECGLSAGAVSAIISNLRNSVGPDLVDQLRALSVTLRKLGIPVTEAIKCFRVFNIMKKLGVDEEAFESFILETYNRCTGSGLNPEQIGSCLNDLVSFWSAGETEKVEDKGHEDRREEMIPLFSEIPGHLARLKVVKTNLEKEISSLRNGRNDLQNETRLLKTERLKAMEQLNDELSKHDLTSDVLKWYSELREELRGIGIPVDNVKSFANSVKWINEKGVDLSKLVNLFHSYSEMINEHVALHSKVEKLRSTANDLEEKISSHKLKLSEIGELESMGMSLRRLKQLHNTLLEISEENELPPESVISRFFADLESDYDEVIGFDIKIGKLRDMYERLNENYNNVSSRLSKIPHVGGAIASLLSRGVNEDDIVRLSNLLNSRPELFRTMLSSSPADTDKDNDASFPASTNGTRRNQNSPGEPRNAEAERS